jgi:hypothetical protein
MPARFQKVEAICERKGGFGKVKFTAANMMGTAVSGSEEVFRIRYDKGFCEFGFIGKCKMAILAFIFKSLIPDWLVIIVFSASRNVSDVVELPALTSWEPEQDVAQDAREIKIPQRVVEERGRGTFIKRGATCNESWTANPSWSSQSN